MSTTMNAAKRLVLLEGYFPKIWVVLLGVSWNLSVADPELKLRGAEGGGNLLALLAFLPSVISSCFTQNNRGGQAPLGPSLDLSLEDAQTTVC